MKITKTDLIFLISILIFASLYLVFNENRFGELCGFAFGGSLGSFLIAKFVINTKTEKELNSIKQSEKQKQTVIDNLLWIFQNFEITTVDENGKVYPSARPDYESYNKGFQEGIKRLRKNYLDRVSYGFSSGDIYTTYWGDKENT